MTADEINSRVLRPTLSINWNDTPEATSWNVPIMIHAVFESMVDPDILNNVEEYWITPPAPDIRCTSTRHKDMIVTLVKNFLKPFEYNVINYCKNLESRTHGRVRSVTASCNQR